VHCAIQQWTEWVNESVWAEGRGEVLVEVGMVGGPRVHFGDGRDRSRWSRVCEGLSLDDFGCCRRVHAVGD